MWGMKTKTLFLVWALSGACTLSQGAPQRVLIEAESAVMQEAPFVKVAPDAPPEGVTVVQGASAAYLEVPLGKGKAPEEKENAAKAVFAFEAPEEGGYFLWLRVYWEGECSNSFNARFDDGPVFLVGEDPTFKKWHWVKYPVARSAQPRKLTKGGHTLTLFHREDGVRVDQILLTTDRRYVPVDIEKAGE